VADNAAPSSAITTGLVTFVRLKRLSAAAIDTPMEFDDPATELRFKKSH